MPDLSRMRLWLCVVILLALTVFSGCSRNTPDAAGGPDIPRGYMQTLEIEMGGQLLRFGPFMGYYFKPDTSDNLSYLNVLCFNENSFYTRDMQENALLFKGEAILTTLEPADIRRKGEGRIFPVFFDQAPQSWRQSRPGPEDEFLHFHSCYDKSGPVLTGYWLRHRGMAAFTYDMGQRVNKNSPLYHLVTSGIDRNFAKIIEFDRGPRY